jgi:hypothetical protein
VANQPSLPHPFGLNQNLQRGFEAIQPENFAAEQAKTMLFGPRRRPKEYVSAVCFALLSIR